MSVCRVCARDRADAAATAPLTATLLLRVWQEAGGPRARLLGVRDPGGETYAVGAAQGVDDIVTAVRQWVVAAAGEERPD